MSQFDPMKDPTDKTDTQRNTYTYRTDDGRGYTNPDGSHGFIYNPEGMKGDRKTRRYRGAMIALSTVIAALLLVICCLAGAFFALGNLGPVTPPKDTTADTNQGTSDGISIQDPDKGDGTQTGSCAPGRRMGLEMFDLIDPKNVGIHAARQAVTMAGAGSQKFDFAKRKRFSPLRMTYSNNVLMNSIGFPFREIYNSPYK